MSSPLPDKLRDYIRQAKGWLTTKWQQVRASWQDETTADVPDVTDLFAATGTAEVFPPGASEDFGAQLREVADRKHATGLAQGQIHERSCPPLAGSWSSRRRDYLVYVPTDYREEEPLPVVVLLHGCRQTNEDIRAISGFDAIAERERFIVVYPFVTGYWGVRNRNCWGWWVSSHIRAGSGEVEDIGRIVQQVQDEFSVDAQRIHIAGLSSGAGMTVAALVAHGQLFASGASVAGVAYGESARAVKISSFLPVKYRSLNYIVRRMRDQLAIAGRGRLASLLVIQSEADATVELQSGLNLRDSWLAVNSINVTSAVPTVRGETRGIHWHYQRYGQPGADKSVDLLITEKLPHCWIGGLPGAYSDPRGPNISEVIWMYFKR